LAGSFAGELLAAAIVFGFGGPKWAFWSFAAATVLDAVYTTITLKRFAKEAWKHALPTGAAAPPSRAVVELAPHSARDYNSPAWLWTLRAATALALVMLAVDWTRSASADVSMFSVPAIVL